VTSPLENLSGAGKALRKEAPDPKEFGRWISPGEPLHRLPGCPAHLGTRPEVWRVLARAHDLRNRGEYEGDIYVDEQLLADLIVACKTVAAALSKLPDL